MSKESDEAHRTAQAEVAFKKAQSDIARAKAERATALVLSDSELDRIPEEIGTLNTLTELQLINTQVRNLSPISALPSLSKLSVNFAPVEDIGPIGKLTNLVYLDLRHTHPKDLKSLSNLTKLEVIDLAYTAVSDVSALSKLTRLRQINMKTNYVLDFRPFRNIIIPETASERPNDFWGFSQCRNEYISDFDPQFSDMLDSGLAGFRNAIAYLNGLDDAEYDRRLTAWRAAQVVSLRPESYSSEPRAAPAAHHLTQARTLIAFPKAHSALARDHAAQITKALNDYCNANRINQLPPELQTFEQIAQKLTLLSDSLSSATALGPDPTARRLAELEAACLALSEQLLQETARADRAEAELKATGFWPAYRMTAGEEAAKTTFWILKSVSVTGLAYLLGVNAASVQAFLRLLEASL